MIVLDIEGKHKFKRLAIYTLYKY